MQYRNNTKILIDKRKLDTLLRLGCNEDLIWNYIKTGNYQATGDSLIDDNLESLIDIKDFENWGGARKGAGRKSNKNKDIIQVENQVEIQVENQDANQDMNQVEDIDIYNNINNNIQEKEIYKEKEVLLLGEQKEETESCKKYMGYTDNELCEKTLYNWNEWIAKDNGFPKISGVNKTRLSKLKARMKQAGGYREFWEKLDSAIKDSRFLRFGNETWTCNFDFVLQESSYTKILEHQYK